jgi:hypothetical protein
MASARGRRWLTRLRPATATPTTTTTTRRRRRRRRMAVLTVTVKARAVEAALVAAAALLVPFRPQEAVNTELRRDQALVTTPDGA